MINIANCFSPSGCISSLEPNQVGAVVSLATLVATIIAPQIFGAYAFYVGSAAAITFIATLISSRKSEKSGPNPVSVAPKIETLKSSPNLNSCVKDLNEGRVITIEGLYKVKLYNGAVGFERIAAPVGCPFFMSESQERALFSELVGLSFALGCKGQLHLDAPAYENYIELYKSLGMEIEATQYMSVASWQYWINENNGNTLIPLKMSEEGLKRWIEG